MEKRIGSSLNIVAQYWFGISALQKQIRSNWRNQRHYASCENQQCESRYHRVKSGFPGANVIGRVHTTQHLPTGHKRTVAHAHIHAWRHMKKTAKHSPKEKYHQYSCGNAFSHVFIYAHSIPILLLPIYCLLIKLGIYSSNFPTAVLALNAEHSKLHW